MKMAVVAANGRVAQKVVKEALDRGFEVKAFGRGTENKTAVSDYVQKNIMDLTKDDHHSENLGTAKKRRAYRGSKRDRWRYTYQTIIRDYFL